MLNIEALVITSFLLMFCPLFNKIIKDNGITYSTINAKLTHIEKHFIDFENSCKINSVEVTTEMVRETFQNEFGKNKITPTADIIIIKNDTIPITNSLDDLLIETLLLNNV